MSDWTTARVVRDCDGELWGNDGSSAYWDYVGTCGYSGGVPASLVAAGGDPTPVLDADGLPVVRTVGDLTARHIGRRVRVGGADPAVLHSLSVRSGMYVPEVIISTGLSGGFYITLDITCELLPEGDA